MKPRILLLPDVVGWCWDHKCQQIVKHLKDYFDFKIHYTVQEGKLPKDYGSQFDLFLTFAPKYVDMLESRNVPIERRITGVTAHFLGIEDDLKSRIGKVKYVHANSVMLTYEIRKYYKDTFYVPNGVDPSIFYKDARVEKSSKFVVGHVGKSAPRKGFDRIIKPAFDDCADSGMKLKANQRRYHDALSQDEMREWYQDVDVMVFASDIDGTPNPMLEAAAIGIPSIINRIGNAPEFIHNMTNGIIVDEVGVTNYADAIRWMRDHPLERQVMGMRAKETVMRDWTWAMQVKNYDHMFRSILNYEK